MTVLHTRHLTLSPCSPADRADFVALERDADVMRFLNGGIIGDPESGPEPNYLRPRGTEPHVWSARRSDGAFVGWFCLWPDAPTLAELGYRLRREEWGHGLATEGAIALVQWGFESAGYDRITACTMAVNLASRRVMEKIGLRYARTVDMSDPIPGAEHGEVYYEATREVWKARGFTRRLA